MREGPQKEWEKKEMLLCKKAEEKTFGLPEA